MASELATLVRFLESKHAESMKHYKACCAIPDHAKALELRGAVEAYTVALHQAKISDANAATSKCGEPAEPLGDNQP